MKTLYKEISSKLSKINFEHIYPKFHLYPFALYDDNKICFHNNEMPRPACFYGNTAIEYEGELIAIWYLPQIDNTIDTDILTANLVHEMFHAFQKENSVIKEYPNDLKLLQYPQDVANYTAKYYENLLIADGISASFEEKLILYKMIQTQRNIRIQTINEYLEQEILVETLEGQAECCGLLALNQLCEDKYQQKIMAYTSILKNDYTMLLDIRRVSYFSGALLKLIERDIHEKGFARIGSCTDSALTHTIDTNKYENDSTSEVLIKKAVINDRQSKEQIITEFFKKNRIYNAIDTYICGYDPMNQFRVKDYLFAKNMIYLMVDGTPKKIEGPVIICMTGGSDNSVEGFYI